MISIITPVLNESDNIKPFFEHINSLSGKFELILVDGGSVDTTIDEINREGKNFKKKLTIIKTYQGRGNQMNKGAAVAKGEILLFLHIDCKLEKETILFIEKEIKENKIIGGGLYQEFLNSDDFLKLATNFGNLRSRITKIFFGDCGIFIRKDIFELAGGYDDIVFLEDVEFCKKVKKYGKLKQINCKIYSSPRRYLKIGKIKISIIFTLTYLLNLFGFRPTFLIKYIVNK
jgi:rSAM/selenodomain-associated transferase 2